MALLALPVAFLVGLCFAAIGLVMTVLARNWDFFSFYLTLVLTPMVMISGVFFPMDRLPAAMQAVAQVLPLHHGVALVRPLVAGQWPADAALHVGVLLAYTVAAWGLAAGTARRRFAG
jgi:lipooligosaccharide transport system permease protein